MSNAKKTVFTALLLINSIFCFGQKGCVVGTMLYPNYEFSGALFEYYYNTNPRPTTAPNCPRVQLGAPTGRSCKFGTLAVLSYTEYNFTPINPPVQCPLDENSFLLVVLSGFLGSFFIKKYKNCMMI